MKRSLLGRLFSTLALFAVMSVWTPRESADALVLDTTTFQVAAVVDETCSIVVQSLSFGVYDPLSPAPRDAAGQYVLTCANSNGNFVLHVRMGQGTYPAPGSTNANPRRRMARSLGGFQLRYDLYRNAARTQVWGNTPATSHFPGNGPYPMVVQVYGRIPALQAALPGSYSDTVVATLQF